MTRPQKHQALPPIYPSSLIPKFPSQPLQRSGWAAEECIEDLRSVWDRQDWTFFKERPNRPFNINLFGVRNPHHTHQTTGRFNDFLGVAYWNKRGVPIVSMYSATTEPGTPLIVRPVNSNGAGSIAKGQYRGAYEIGKFNGADAFRQVGKVLVHRDNDGDRLFEFHDVVEMGWGFFIHKRSRRAERINGNRVGGSSAGCQVTEHHDDWEMLIAEGYAAREEWGSRITYTLLDMHDLNPAVWQWNAGNL